MSGPTFLVWNGEATEGPFPPAEVLELIRAGVLGAESWICAGGDEWFEASNLERVNAVVVVAAAAASRGRAATPILASDLGATVSPESPLLGAAAGSIAEFVRSLDVPFAAKCPKCRRPEFACRCTFEPPMIVPASRGPAPHAGLRVDLEGNRRREESQREWERRRPI